MRMHKKTLGTTVLFACFALEELCIKYRHDPPPSPPQATDGSPEGLVPLALSAQDRQPRRRKGSVTALIDWQREGAYFSANLQKGLDMEYTPDVTI